MKDENYKDKTKKATAFEDLTMELWRNDEQFLSITIEEVKIKLRSIRNTYYQESNKIKNSKSTGAATETVYKPKLCWFEEADDIFKDSTIPRPKKNIGMNLVRLFIGIFNLCWCIQLICTFFNFFSDKRTN